MEKLRCIECNTTTWVVVPDQLCDRHYIDKKVKENLKPNFEKVDKVMENNLSNVSE